MIASKYVLSQEILFDRLKRDMQMERFIAIKKGEMSNYDNKWTKIAATLSFVFVFLLILLRCALGDGSIVWPVAGGGGGASEMLGIGEVLFYTCVCICVCF